MRVSSPLVAAAIFAKLLTSPISVEQARSADSIRSIVPTPGVGSMRALEQNWSHDEAEWFYTVPQGSRIMPYSWFVRLEQPESDQPFLDPEYLQKFGLLARRPDADRNPHGLPVGFVKDANADAMGLTCAACHTNQINFEGTALIVDGAPSLMDVSAALVALEKALDATASDPQKFSRFADAVLAQRTPQTDAILRLQLQAAALKRRDYNVRNLPADPVNAFGRGRIDAFGAILNEVLVRFVGDPLNHAPANAPVSYPFLWDTPQHDLVQWNGAAENKRNIFLKPIIGTADFGALGRNVGEVLGVFGDADVTQSFGVLGGYASSVDRDHLIEIEESLRSLWSPQWPEEFPDLDPDLLADGRELFKSHCRTCHQDITRDDPDRAVVAKMRAVGTDPWMARNFAARASRTGPLEGRRTSLVGFATFGPEAPGGEILSHVVQRIVVGPAGAAGGVQDAAAGAFGGELAAQPSVEANPAQAAQTLGTTVGDWQLRINAEVTVDGQTLSGAFESATLEDDRVQSLRGGTRVKIVDEATETPVEASPEAGLVVPQGDASTAWNTITRELNVANEADGVLLADVSAASVRFQYKGRPLNGIWATAPYLHNGSVPTLAQLLKKTSDREPKFFVGEREFLPDEVGFVYESGPSEFDTSKPGNSNAGHEFGVDLTEAEKQALLEYLKSL